MKIKLTWLFLLNFILLQWTGIRLARVTEMGKPVGFRLVGFILPLTGWRTPYKFILRFFC